MINKSISPYLFHNGENFNMSLNVSSAGKSVRTETGSWYFLPENFYTFHYIISGKASFTHGKNKFEVGANDVIVIHPGTFCELTVHEVPYVNCWINFKGIDILNLLSYTDITPSSVVFHSNENLEELFENLYNMQGPEPYHQAQLLSTVYNIFSFIMKNSSTNHSINYKKYYISKFLSYVEENYGSDIQIPDIANFIGFSSSQLYRVVSEEFGVSPVKFLTDYRLNKSKIFLKEKDIKINIVAKLCGFSDPQYFSKVFQKHTGMTPSEFKNSSKD